MTGRYSRPSPRIAAAWRGVGRLDLADEGVAVFLMHPGWVSTEMTGGTGIPVSESAEGLIQTMDGLTMEKTGTFWHQEGYQLPW